MAGLGLLNWQSDAELEERENEELDRQREQERQRQEQVETSLAAHIRRSWEDAKQARRDVDQRLLDCLRRYKGEYSDEKLREIERTGGSALYIKLTTTKCRAAESWIRDILMPVNEKPWGLEPTPIADIPEPIRMGLIQQVQQQLMAMQQQGEPVDDSTVQQMLKQAEDNIKAQVQDLAEEAADHMELEIEDQLAEGGWREALERFIADFATYPTAILKGPVLRRRKVLGWQEGWIPVQMDEIRPEFEAVSPFDFYPSPDATDIDDASYLIERLRFTRGQINTLAGVDGYNEEAIAEVLRDYGQGGLRDWIWNDTERHRLEGKSHDLLSSSDTIDGLHYWGGAQGLTLLQWGMTPEQIPDPLAEYQVEAILIGRHCIRCVIHNDPMNRRPYHKASFQNVSGSFWGMGIPELMADIQDLCNATGRSLVNNLAISSGPQVDVSMDRLDPTEDAEDIYPWKVWRTRSDKFGGSSTKKAIEFFQPQSNSAELMQVFNQFEQKADDATNVPRYIYGNEKIGGAGNTASGLSMLMESANKGIKAAVGHIDTGMIRRVIEAMWLHNMQYSEKQSIKGDCKVVAKGSSAMLQREQAQVRQQELFGMIADEGIIRRALGVRGQVKLLRAVTENVGINNLVPRDVEDQIEAEMQEDDPQQQLELAEMEAKLEKLRAETQRLEAQGMEAMQRAEHEPVKSEKTAAEVQKLLAEITNLLNRGVINDRPQRAGAHRRALPGHRSPGQVQRPGMAGAQPMAGQPTGRSLGLAG